MNNGDVDDYEDEEEGCPQAEEPVTAPVYNPDSVHHVGLGTVKSMTLINFMCHEHFSIDFGSQINFVIGRNGSGKSAILTALVVCFGGRAGITSRGKAVKSFIKKGQQTARVIVTLCNHSNGETDYSFKHDSYGDEITIERTFRSDSSAYAVRNQWSHVVEKTKKEVDAIVRHFSIQIDNPVVILNQEVSRNFLNSRKDKDKYKFFMRATNLEVYKENMITLRQRLEWARRTEMEKRQILPDLEREVSLLKSKLDRLQSVKKYRDRKVSREQELLWSYVKEKEKNLEAVEKELAAEVAKLDVLQKNSDAYEENIAEMRREQQALNDKCQEKSDLLNVATRNAEVARKALEDKEKKKQEIRTELRCQMMKDAEMGKVVQEFEEGLRKEIERQGDPQEIVRKRRERQQKIESLEVERAEVQKSLEEKQHTINQLKTWLDTNQGTLERMVGTRTNLQRQVGGIKSRISQLENSRGDTRAMFGRYVPEINSRIDAAFSQGKFKHKPIGPIGQYIKLKDAGVSIALQAVMKSLVRAYAVDNRNDQSVLKDIFRSVISDTQYFPQIITRRFTNSKFDVSRNLVDDEEVKSLIEYITVIDNNAFNVLIDKTGLESVAYIADNKHAERLLLNIRTVPANCRKAYSKDGTEFNPTAHNRGYSMYPNEYGNRPDVFSLDIVGQVAHLKQQLTEKQTELKQIRDEGSNLRTSIENRKNQMRQLDSDCQTLRDQRSKVIREVTGLKDFTEPEPMSITNLQDELNEKKQQKRDLEEEVKVLEEQVKQTEELIKKAEDELAEKEELKREAKTKLDLCTSRRGKMIEDIRNMESSRSQRQLQVQTEKVDVLKNKKTTAEEEVGEKMTIASAECDRIETNKTPDDLKHQIRELEKLIHQCEKETGTEKDVTERYNKAHSNLSKDKDIIQIVSSCINRCKEMLERRREFFYRTRDTIVQKMKLEFVKCLNGLDYSGTLEIDHGGRQVVNGEPVIREPKLTLKVNPKKNQSSGEYDDTRSLSGGERSFSTVAFLLALWEGCCSPFRILDEVDVFMDMVTRQVAMDALVAAAKRNKRQYIFLSPLPLIQDHANQNDIKIHNMPEPEQVSQEDAHM